MNATGSLGGSSQLQNASQKVGSYLTSSLVLSIAIRNLTKWHTSSATHHFGPLRAVPTEWSEARKERQSRNQLPLKSICGFYTTGRYPLHQYSRESSPAPLGKLARIRVYGLGRMRACCEISCGVTEQRRRHASCFVFATRGMQHHCKTSLSSAARGSELCTF